ncbi:MAG: hypothetical protein HOI84_01955, partial [Flavobacteriaceae bacterium]|nr:hypothetical protein [Flavobacteriaceae bacterium]
LSENGTTFVLTQTATSETTDVVIDQAATAEEIGEAIKAAAGTFTIYVQPEVQDDGSLHIFADEAFTISAN